VTADATTHVAVSGASGLVGSRIVSDLIATGHRVSRLVRRSPRSDDEIYWDPLKREIEQAKLVGVDALIHLAGENIATGRWTTRRKASIHDSRVNGTRFLAETIAGLVGGPRTMLSASAIGYYGDRGEHPLDETSAAGDGYLAETCRDWEAGTAPAEAVGIRVVHLRIGVVLSASGGALQRMLPPFKAGLGGRLGNGRQYMSWISIDDLVRGCRFLLENDRLRGAFNLVAPTPVRNLDFTRALGRTLGRPTVLPLPGMIIRLLLGEMGQELLLAGARIHPRRLEQAGFEFLHPDLKRALVHLLGPAEYVGK
jgi:uncharacterized protein (TIGR01777 family)